MNGFMISRVWAGLILLWAIVMVAVRAPLPLLEPEEARYAEISRQMLDQGQLLIPIRDGQDYLDKPPLLYWMVMASYQVFGVTDWSARLPTILTGWLTIVVVMGWGWRTAGAGVGLCGGGVLALTGDFLYRAPMVTMNGPLALCVTMSLAAAHIALLSPAIDRRWWLASSAACGVGIMMKGPVALALTLPPIVMASLLDRRLNRPSWLAIGAWISLAGVIAGPWHLTVALSRPGFVNYFFWKHHVERFTAPFDHAGPIWQYAPQLLAGFLPWTMVAGTLAARRFLRASNPDSLPLCSTTRFAFLAGVWGFVFFSLAGSKRPVYLVPVEPLFALAAGAFFWQLRSSLNPTAWFSIGGVTAGVLAFGVVLGMPEYSRQFSVAELVRLPAVADEPAETPIACYGHGWDSIAFHRNTSMRIPAFLGDHRQDITSLLANQRRTIVFVTTKRIGGDFADHVPAGCVVHWLGANRQARVALVVNHRICEIVDD